MSALPASMRAVEIAGFGGPEVLRPVERPLPEPSAEQILIRVAAAGVNRPDALQRAGNYPVPPGASDLPGLEAAGEVVAVGASVTRWKPGDLVAALLPGGGYAEFAVTHQDHALPVPEGLPLIEAAALPETAFTVWSNVFTRGGLRAGETFLVHGGSSGIGTMAIQLASAFGARVIATAGSQAKCDVCRELGAELAINYRDTDFGEAVKKFSGGADVILDMVGGEYIGRNIRLLNPDGRLVQIAFLQGSKAEINFAQVMIKRQTITGSTLRPQSDAAKARIAEDVLRNVWPLVTSGRVRPVMDQVFALEEAADAHARMESSAHIGKIMLQI